MPSELTVFEVLVRWAETQGPCLSREEKTVGCASGGGAPVVPGLGRLGKRVAGGVRPLLGACPSTRPARRSAMRVRIKKDELLKVYLDHMRARAHMMRL